MQQYILKRHPRISVSSMVILKDLMHMAESLMEKALIATF